MEENKAKVVFWHRELPPLEADVVAEHTVGQSKGQPAGA